MGISNMLFVLWALQTTSSFILPMQANGTADLNSIVYHVTLLEQKVDGYEKELQTANTNINVLSSKVDTMTNQLNSANEEINRLEIQKAVLSHDLSRFDSSNQTANTNINVLSSKVDTLTTKLDSANEKINELQIQNAVLSHDLSRIDPYTQTNSSGVLSVGDYDRDMEALRSAAWANNLIKDTQVMFVNGSKDNGMITVAFQAVLQQNGIHIQNKEYLKFDNIAMNIGDAYNRFTGVFTVPVTGVYIFWANIQSYDSGDFVIELVKDGKMIVNGFTGSDQTYGTASLMYISKFHKGESIAFRNKQFADGTVLEGAGLSSYGGVLIGE